MDFGNLKLAARLKCRLLSTAPLCLGMVRVLSVRGFHPEVRSFVAHGEVWIQVLHGEHSF